MRHYDVHPNTRHGDVPPHTRHDDVPSNTRYDDVPYNTRHDDVPYITRHLVYFEYTIKSLCKSFNDICRILSDISFRTTLTQFDVNGKVMETQEQKVSKLIQSMD